MHILTGASKWCMINQRKGNMMKNAKVSERPVKTYATSVNANKKTQKQDETEYLTSNPTNKASLDKSIAQGRRGEFRDCKLFS